MKDALLRGRLGNIEAAITRAAIPVSPEFAVSLGSRPPAGARDIVQADGYSASGDRGGGIFYWNETDTRAPDGGTIFTANGFTVGRWNRAYSGALDVHWFGAVGNGGIDGSGTNDTNAVMRAVAAANAAGGTVKFHALPYLIDPVIQILHSGVTLQGDGGTFDFQTPVLLQTQGTRLIISSPGTAIRGPNFGGSKAASNVSCCSIRDVAIYWSVLARGAPGCIGVDESGFNRSPMYNVLVVLPKGATNSYCYYATTRSAGGVAQACYYNEHFNCSGFADENNASGALVSGTKGIYYQFNPTANYTQDGGGVNGNSWYGGTFGACETAIHWGRQDGCKALGITVEGYWSHGVVLGVSDANSGSSNGCKIDIKYAETTTNNTSSFLVKIGDRTSNGMRVNFNEIDVGVANLSIWGRDSAGQGTQTTCTVPGLIDPSSFLGNNTVKYNSAIHGGLGGQIIMPFPTSKGVVSGRSAVQGPPPLPSTATTIVQLVADFNAFVARLQESGTMEEYHPVQEGAVLNWWRADCGNARLPNSSNASWRDLIGAGVVATAAGHPVYQVGVYSNQEAPPNQLPYFVMDGASYWTALLASTVTECSIVALVQTGAPAATQGFVELTPAGIVGTGVTLMNTSTSVVARKLASNDAIAPQAAINANWHVVGATFTNAGVKLFIDGKLVSTNLDGNVVPSMSQLCIGALGAGTVDVMIGGVREVIVWAPSIADLGHANVYSYLKQHNALIY